MKLTDDVAFLLKSGVPKARLQRMSDEDKALAAQSMRAMKDEARQTVARSVGRAGHCRSCGCEVAVNARICPHCGHVGTPHAGMATALKIIWGTIAVLLVLAFLL